MEWLPELVCCDGLNWIEIVELIYPVFRRDFVESAPALDGLPIKLKNIPMKDNKEWEFWHFVTVGQNESSRRPDMERCKRIGWFRAIVDHADDDRLMRWEQERDGKTSCVIGLPDFSYLAILGKRTPAEEDPYFLPLT